MFRFSVLSLRCYLQCYYKLLQTQHLLFCQQKKKILDDVVAAAKTPNGRSVYIMPMGTAGKKKKKRLRNGTERNYVKISRITEEKMEKSSAVR